VRIWTPGVSKAHSGVQKIRPSRQYWAQWGIAPRVRCTYGRLSVETCSSSKGSRCATCEEKRQTATLNTEGFGFRSLSRTPHWARMAMNHCRTCAACTLCRQNRGAVCPVDDLVRIAVWHRRPANQRYRDLSLVLGGLRNGGLRPATCGHYSHIRSAPPPTQESRKIPKSRME